MNKNGYTLIEVSAAIVLAGIATAAFMSVMQMVSTNIALELHGAAASDTLDDLAQSFSDNERTCTRNLESFVFDPTASVQIPRLDRFDVNGVRRGAIAAIGETLGNSGLVVRDITFTTLSSVNPNVYVSSLQIRLQRTTGHAGAEILRTIPLMVSVFNNRIQFCSTSPINLYTANDRQCELWSSGWSNFVIYSATEAWCTDDPRVIWAAAPNVPSPLPTQRRATCPAGHRIAATPHDPQAQDYICYTNSRGTPVTPRLYTDGSRSGGFRFLYVKTIDWATQSCLFDFDPAEDLSTATAEVKCVPNGARPL